MTVFWLLIIFKNIKGELYNFDKNKVVMMDIEEKNKKDRKSVHKSVMSKEVLQWLDLKEGMVVADLTVGAGGHSLDILRRIGQTGRLIAIDKDESIIDLLPAELKKAENVNVVCASFTDIDKVSRDLQVDKYDRILLDLGVSSWQLDNNNRGFSYQTDAVLDMRMNHQGMTAAEILNESSEEDLVRIWREYADIKRAKALAKKVVSFRRAKGFTYVSDLKNLIEEFAYFKEKKRNILGRVWQALRIEVNQEIDELQTVLRLATARLKQNGRIVIISFHSGEDKVVKDFFRENSRGCVCPKEFPVCKCETVKVLKVLTKKPIVPTEDEIKNNIRSHSAKLRVAEKL